jgi:hypothetical protein
MVHVAIHTGSHMAVHPWSHREWGMTTFVQYHADLHELRIYRQDGHYWTFKIYDTELGERAEQFITDAALEFAAAHILAAKAAEVSKGETKASWQRMAKQEGVDWLFSQPSYSASDKGDVKKGETEE